MSSKFAKRRETIDFASRASDIRLGENSKRGNASVGRVRPSDLKI